MKDFELHLKKAGLAENTVRSYLYGVRFFLGELRTQNGRFI
nr:hypothetical protein [Streptococcus pneumoniae]